MGIQIAPLIDVMILLLAFFVISWKFSRFETEIDISLPAAEEGQALNREYNEIVVNVHKDGRVVVDTQQLPRGETPWPAGKNRQNQSECGWRSSCGATVRRPTSRSWRC